MKKQMLDKVKMAEDFLKNGKGEDKAEFLKYLMRWIVWFQHERFIHLMVTLFFALFSIAMLFAFIVFVDIRIGVLFGVLFLIFGITTGFYINHYYLLENKTQYLYKLYDEIEKK